MRPRADVAAFAADPDNATSWWFAPVMATAMQRANTKDLQPLKKILETGGRRS